jgi:hypothetical protein
MNVQPEADWQRYEKEIEAYFRSEYPEAAITPNAALPGKFSKIDRQIDLLVEVRASDLGFRLIVDAKHYKERIDVKDVEQFLGLLRDVSADIGVMISPEGYSEAAINRAHYDDSRVILDILNSKDLEHYQGFGAIPFADDCGVLLPAPFGWVIDARRSEHWLACMYPQGSTLENAVTANEWSYIKISTKRAPASNLDELLAIHDGRMKEQPNAEIKYLPPVQRPDNARTAVRLFETDGYRGFCEYTGFIEFESAIFFCVVFTPLELAEKNLRNLRYILRKSLPLRVVRGS